MNSAVAFVAVVPLVSAFGVVRTMDSASADVLVADSVVVVVVEPLHS